jgi:hypothetical protein
LAKVKGYKSGDVVWAKVADRNGVTKPEPRPLLVIRPEPVQNSPLCCLGISTRRAVDPDDPVIEMPWDAATGDTTGLYEWCAVVLLWFVLLPLEDVEEKSGVVRPSFLEDVISRREFAQLFPRH